MARPLWVRLLLQALAAHPATRGFAEIMRLAAAGPRERGRGEKSLLDFSMARG
eukprot:COSAG06_NODE_59_length_27189_cov_21.724527_22_plen_53_part_00